MPTARLRRYAQGLWHRHLRLKLSSPTNCIVYDILLFRKGTYVARYVHLLLVFHVSGMVHIVFEVVQGIKYYESGAARFFLTQVLGQNELREDQGKLKACT